MTILSALHSLQAIQRLQSKIRVGEYCRKEKCIGLYIPDHQEISRGPRDVLKDIWRPQENLEIRFISAQDIKTVYGHSLIINLSLGMYQKIHPNRVSCIASAKINALLLMRRERPKCKQAAWVHVKTWFL